MIVLEAREVHCAYGARSILESLTLEVREGEVLVLLGPNGAGKTTLLRALSRLLRPARGTVVLEDREIWSRPPADVARRLALMPQSERQDSDLTVEEAVGLGRAPHRGWLLPLAANDHRIIEKALEMTATAALRSRPIATLSGGEWRRVVLARALAQQAQVLLLDELVSGLDPRFQIEMLELVRGLAVRDRRAVVLTLHDLNLAAIYGDRIALLTERRLVHVGAPREVLTAELVEQVFGISVMITPHPVYGTPLVVPLTNLPPRDCD